MKIKYKFILFFVPVFTLALVAVSFMNIRLFEDDKIAYVFSTTLETTKMASQNLRSGIALQKPLVELLISSFDFANKRFPDESKAHLQVSSNVAYVAMSSISNGAPLLLGELGQKPEGLDVPLKSTEPLKPIFFDSRKDLWAIANGFKVKGYQPEDYTLTVVFRSNPLTETMNEPRISDLFLIDRSGHVIAQPPQLADPTSAKELAAHVKEIVGANAVTKEFGNQLVAWSPVAGTDFGFVSFTPKSKAVSAIEDMKRTSLGFLLVLISIGLIAVLLLIKALTNSIESLTRSLTKFSEGDLETKAEVRSKDEIGLMSRVFNEMTERIVTLLRQSVQQARMESELDTARQVQAKMVPEPDFIAPQVRIGGYFEPASECGGDWWHYTVDTDTCWILIADVTGHGVASALITASLRAGVAALQNIRTLSLEDYVAQLNSVIYESGRGQLMCTFYIARIDLHTGDVKYVNASHWSPIVLRKDGEIDADASAVIGGPRLGERKDVEFKSGTFKVSEKDVVLVFTDGLSEFETPDGKLFGERRINKCVTKAAEAGSDVSVFRDDLLAEFKKFQKDIPLPDDLTFSFFQFFPDQSETSGQDATA